MAVIYLNRRKKLTEEQKRVATSLLQNEINDVHGFYGRDTAQTSVPHTSTATPLLVMPR